MAAQAGYSPSFKALGFSGEWSPMFRFRRVARVERMDEWDRGVRPRERDTWYGGMREGRERRRSGRRGEVVRGVMRVDIDGMIE